MDDLKEKLKTEIEIADWDMLRVHHEREAVFMVDRSIDLLVAAVAIAQDNSSLVSIWITDSKLARPEDSKVEEYELEKYKKNFDFIIIQPYVLVQLKACETLS
jgi:hypothetical protein